MEVGKQAAAYLIAFVIIIMFGASMVMLGLGVTVLNPYTYIRVADNDVFMKGVSHTLDETVSEISRRMNIDKELIEVPDDKELSEIVSKNLGEIPEVLKGGSYSYSLNYSELENDITGAYSEVLDKNQAATIVSEIEAIVQNVTRVFDFGFVKHSFGSVALLLKYSWLIAVACAGMGLVMLCLLRWLDKENFLVWLGSVLLCTAVLLITPGMITVVSGITNAGIEPIQLALLFKSVITNIAIYFIVCGILIAAGSGAIFLYRKKHDVCGCMKKDSGV